MSIIDVLRRSGLEVTVAGIGKRDITGAHNITIQADAKLEEVKINPDAIVLPGGMPGADNLRKSDELKKILEYMNKSNKLIGAICAAPAVVLAAHGILRGRKATCYPGYENKLGSETTFLPERVVRDKNIITSRGPGTAIEFALEIVSALVSKEKANELSNAMLVK